jgi:hypothetical protein
MELAHCQGHFDRLQYIVTVRRPAQYNVYLSRFEGLERLLPLKISLTCLPAWKQLELGENRVQLVAPNECGRVTQARVRE